MQVNNSWVNIRLTSLKFHSSKNRIWIQDRITKKQTYVRHVPAQTKANDILQHSGEKFLFQMFRVKETRSGHYSILWKKDEPWFQRCVGKRAYNDDIEKRRITGQDVCVGRMTREVVKWNPKKGSLKSYSYKQPGHSGRGWLDRVYGWGPNILGINKMNPNLIMEFVY